MDPLPVDGLGLDFRDLDERSQRIAQYALSRKILEEVLKQPLDEEQRAEMAASYTRAKERSDANQKKLLDAITPTPTT